MNAWEITEVRRLRGSPTGRDHRQNRAKQVEYKQLLLAEYALILIS